MPSKRSPLVALVLVTASLTVAPARAQSTVSATSPTNEYPVAVPFGWPATEADPMKYTRVEDCVHAANRTGGMEVRLLRRDTLQVDHSQHIPPGMAALAKRCLARWPVAQATLLSLPTMWQLALFAGDDSAADQITRREIENVRVRGFPKATQLRLLVPKMEGALLQYPIRTAMVDAMREQLDTLLAEAAGEVAGKGPDLALLKVIADYHGLMSDFVYSSVDLDRMDYEGRIWTRLARGFSKTAKTADDSITVYVARQSAATYFMQVAQLRGRPDATATELAKSVAAANPSVAAELGQLDQYYRSQFPLVDRVLPPIVGTYLFPRDARPVPEPGHVTLVVFVSAACDARCSPAYAMIRRIERAFPELRVVMISHVLGQLRNDPPGPVLAEAERIRSFFMDSLKIAPRLVLDTSAHRKLEGLDRRYINSLFPTTEIFIPELRQEMKAGKNVLMQAGNDRNNKVQTLEATIFELGAGPKLGMVLIGAHGRVVMQDKFTVQREKLLRAIIAHQMPADSNGGVVK